MLHVELLSAYWIMKYMLMKNFCIIIILSLLADYTVVVNVVTSASIIGFACPNSVFNLSSLSSLLPMGEVAHHLIAERALMQVLKVGQCFGCSLSHEVGQTMCGLLEVKQTMSGI